MQWSDETETEEPFLSLVNVPEMVAEFEAQREKAVPRARVARSRVGEKVRYGADEQGETGGGSMGAPGKSDAYRAFALYPAELCFIEK